jgi:hypothetical protein
MLRSRHLMGLLALALLAGACAADDSGGARQQASAPPSAGTESAPVAAAVVAAPPAQETASPFRAATEALAQQRTGRPVALSGVQFTGETQAGQRFDRIVFTFAGDSAAGYHVAYTDKPVRRCGSGQPVSVAGTARLVVRLEPAQAHDEHGSPTPANRAPTVRLPVVKDMKLTCDFEGQVEWVLGLEGKHPFRVTELTGPPRLAIDVAHPE